jgi:hypothetical protein
MVTFKHPALTDTVPDLGVYVACLASYNAGRLYGRWVDLTRCGSLEDVQCAVDEVLAHSPMPGAEEYGLHDSSGLACTNEGKVLDSADYGYEGHWPSPEAYAESLANETGAIPDALRWPMAHIDWKSAWSDLSCDGYWAHRSAVSPGFHIFRAY